MKKNLKNLTSAVLFIIVIVLALPHTGLLQQLIWQIDSAPLGPNGKNLAQELGFDKQTKLLIVNSDDTGASPTFTHGILAVMPFGLVRSNSVIVHDRNDDELKRIASIAQQNPNWGFGAHLMLTNEYQQRYPWSPVLSKQQVPSLYNQQGLAWAKITEVEMFANPVDVKQEFIAQIQKAIDIGIDIDHIDSHMGTYYRQSTFPGAKADDLINAAIATADHFNLPMTLNTFDELSKHNIEYADQLGIIRPDTFFGFYELEEINNYFSYRETDAWRYLTAWFVKNTFGFELPYENKNLLADDIRIRSHIYQQALLNIAKPGLNHFYMHAAIEHPSDGHNIPYGTNHAEGVDKTARSGDSAVWSSNEMKVFLTSNEFKLINYTDVRKVQRQWRALRAADHGSQ
jgi:hypothetical protein